MYPKKKKIESCRNYLNQSDPQSNNKKQMNSLKQELQTTVIQMKILLMIIIIILKKVKIVKIVKVIIILIAMIVLAVIRVRVIVTIR